MKAISTDLLFNKQLLYENVFHSCRISGSSLDFNEVRDVIELGTNPNRVTYYDECIIVSDYYEALKESLRLSQNKYKLSVSSIRRIMAIMLRGTSDSIFYNEHEPYRNWNSTLKNTVVPPKEKIDFYLHKLVDKINLEIDNSKDHTLAYKAHFILLGIYPFEKGNTRLGRLLTNYIESYVGLSLTIVNHKNRKEYLEKLDIENVNRNWKSFHFFMQEQLNHEIERQRF